MKKTLLLLLVLCLMLMTVGAYAEATYVLKGGYIYTENADQPEAEAIAVEGDKIVYVGANDTDELNALIGDSTTVIDLEGKMVTPNLIDAHTHPAAVGRTAWHTRMDSWTLEDILAFITGYLAEHSVEEQPFIYFEYYPSNLFGPEGPRKEVLDEIAPDRPILVEDFSDHACWVNSKFLELLQLPEDGSVNTDFFVSDENGYTGWILEGKWRGYVENMYETLNWRPAEECTEAVMSTMTDDLKTWGVTGVMDAHYEQEMQLESISNLDKAGTLNMYYDMSIVLGDYANLEECIEMIHTMGAKYDTDRVKTATMKIFYDGTNELGDAALVDGTVAEPDYHGYLMMDLEQTEQVIRRCNEEKIDVHFHMVGDLAFRQVCDATEAVLAEVGALDIQVEVCHCELIHPDDYNRPAELGIIVNWTPHWSGGYFGDASLQYLGEERYNRMYQFNPIIESGAVVTFGSDCYSMFEENRANPYFGMQTAMTRVDIEYPLDCGMRTPEDAKISLENLLKGYTINAAIQLRIDDITGSLEVGKNANLNVYDVNLFDVPAEEFKDVLPSAVMFEGSIISGELK